MISLFYLFILLVSTSHLPLDYDFSDAINTARDPEYPIYEMGNRKWRIVKLTSWDIMPIFGVNHTEVTISDDRWYVPNKQSGAIGYDIGKNTMRIKDPPPYFSEEDKKKWMKLEMDKRRQKQRLRININTHPKRLISFIDFSFLYLTKEDNERFPEFNIEPICYTDLNQDDIKAFLKQYRGIYMPFGNNCIHFAKRLLKFLCGEEASLKTMKYLYITAPYLGPFERLKFLYKENRDFEWFIHEYMPEEEFQKLREDHEQKMKDYKTKNRKAFPYNQELYSVLL